jgi:hypothetical protein
MADKRPWHLSEKAAVVKYDFFFFIFPSASGRAENGP